MGVKFDADTGMSIDDTATVRSEIATMMKQAFVKDDTTPELNTEPETPAGQIVDGMAALVAAKDAAILLLANNFNPVVAQGIFQDALAKIYFLSRHVAQPTTVTCQCTGLPGTTIPLGAIVADDNGNQYVSTAAVTIPASKTVNVLFRCTQTGAISVNANAITKIITVTPGWDNVNNSSAGIPGRDVETQTEFEERRYNSVAANSHGLAESVGGAVYNLADVVACKIVQNRDSENVTVDGVVVPPHSVYLSVYGGAADDIGMVLHNKLDAGCGTAGNTSVTITDPTNDGLHKYYYTVPVLTPVYVKVSVAANDTFSSAVVSSAVVSSAVVKNFLGQQEGFARVIMGDELYASRFYQTVIDAGLTSLVKIEVSKDGENFGLNVKFDLNEMPTLAESDVTFVEVE